MFKNNMTRDLTLIFFIALCAEVVHAFHIDAQSTRHVSATDILLHPLKYIRSLFMQHAATHPQRHNRHQKGHSKTHRRNVLSDSLDSHHKFLLGTPAIIPCASSKFLANSSSVVWKHAGAPVQQNDYTVASAGELRVNNIQLYDSGEFLCEVEYSNGKSMSFVHEVTVISVPEVLIESKYRYPTDKCDDHTREEFMRRFRSLMSEQVCSKFLCSVGDIDVWCEALRNDKENYEFIVKSFLLVKQSPTRNCDPACTVRQIEKTYYQIRSSLEEEIMENGIVKLLHNDFLYKPKSLAFLDRIYVCREGFEIEKSSDFCLPCKPGTYYGIRKCVLCDIDTYNPGFGATRCMKCPDGRENFVLGATSINECAERKPWVTAATVAIVAGGILVKVCLCCLISRYCFHRRLAKRRNSDKVRELSDKQLLSAESSNTENTSDDDFGEASVSGANSPATSETGSSAPATSSQTSSHAASSPENLSMSWYEAAAPAPLKRSSGVQRLNPVDISSSSSMNTTLSSKQHERRERDAKWSYAPRGKRKLKHSKVHESKGWLEPLSGGEEKWFSDSPASQSVSGNVSDIDNSTFSSSSRASTPLLEYESEKRAEELQREFRKIYSIPPAPDIEESPEFHRDSHIPTLSKEVLEEFRKNTERKRLGGFEEKSPKRWYMSPLVPDFENPLTSKESDMNKIRALADRSKGDSFDAYDRMNRAEFAELLRFKVQDMKRTQSERFMQEPQPSKLAVHEKLQKNRPQEMRSPTITHTEIPTYAAPSALEKVMRSGASDGETRLKQLSYESGMTSSDRKFSSASARPFIQKQNMLRRTLEGKARLNALDKELRRELQPVVSVVERVNPSKESNVKIPTVEQSVPEMREMRTVAQSPTLRRKVREFRQDTREPKANPSALSEDIKQKAASTASSDAIKVHPASVWLPPQVETD